MKNALNASAQLDDVIDASTKSTAVPLVLLSSIIPSAGRPLKTMKADWL